MKLQYRLNPTTLTYERTDKKYTLRLKNILWIFLSAIGFGFIFIILFAYLFPTPQERKLKQDLTVLEKNYDELVVKFEKSVIMYENLLDKEKEIQKLTFDTELEQIQLLFQEMSMYSADFDFTRLMNISYEKLKSSVDKSGKILWKIQLLLELAYAKTIFIENIPAILPIEKPNFVLVSGFGMRIHPIFKTLRQHNGIDFAAQQGTPVVATGSGVVIRPPADLDLLGNVVAIDHGFGYVSIYACLLKPEVRRGNKVTRGQVIGTVGRSGVALGPHLHYEIRKNGNPLNPINYFFLSLTPEEFNMSVEKASIQNQCMS